MSTHPISKLQGQIQKLLCLAVILTCVGSCKEASQPKPKLQAKAEPPAPKRIPDQRPSIPPNTASHSLNICLSNQSASPSSIDFAVFVDDQQIWSGDAELQGGHNILNHQVRVAEGNHVLKVVTRAGSAVATQDFRLDGLLYVAITFWHHPERTSEMTPMFDVRMSLTPIPFG